MLDLLSDPSDINHTVLFDCTEENKTSVASKLLLVYVRNEKVYYF